jgi:hypothetical protein
MIGILYNQKFIAIVCLSLVIRQAIVRETGSLSIQINSPHLYFKLAEDYKRF